MSAQGNLVRSQLSEHRTGHQSWCPGRDVAPSDSWTLSERLQIGLIGIGLVVVLLVARWLRPAAEGFGTHQQLGLPPCTMVMVFGKRCPTCGITTSWAYWTRGRMLKALASSVSGTVLAALATAGVPWLMVSAYRGKWTLVVPTARRFSIVFGVIWIGLLCEWLMRLYWN